MKKCFEGELSYGGIKKIGLSEIKIKENAIETQICSSKNICTKFSYTILHNINSFFNNFSSFFVEILPHGYFL